MKEKDKTLYIANAWRGLITETALGQFADRGWSVDGNWINKKDISPIYKVILAAPANFDGAIAIYPKDFPSSRVFANILYPDELVGWDFQTQTYKMERQEEFIPLLEKSPIIAHSNYTIELALSVYKDVLNPNRQVTYLPIEFNKIREAKEAAFLSEKKSGTKTRVLWNHMWRSDKGVVEALAIINQLASRYPEVEFWIGRAGSWGGNPDVDSVKLKSQSILRNLQSKDNVLFHQAFKLSGMADYWKFLAQFDIGFSVSPQEGFGLSMMEQAAAGIACVLPDREAYPEVHTGGLITDNVAGGISELIENPSRRKEISRRGVENASKFNAEEWSEKILRIIK